MRSAHSSNCVAPVCVDNVKSYTCEVTVAARNLGSLVNTSEATAARRYLGSLRNFSNACLEASRK